MQWEKILVDVVQDGQIRELYLTKIPVLKTTSNWKQIEIIGSIDHQTKHAHYKGGLVRLNEKIYFVKENTIKALESFMKFKFPRKISVISG